MRAKWIVPTLYIIFLLLPIYWLINMSLKTNTEILSTFSLWPQNLTFDNYKVIFPVMSSMGVFWNSRTIPKNSRHSLSDGPALWCPFVRPSHAFAMSC